VLQHCHVCHRATEPPDVGSTKKEQNKSFQKKIKPKHPGYKEQRWNQSKQENKRKEIFESVRT